MENYNINSFFDLHSSSSDADDEDNSLINPQNKFIKKEFHIDKRGKRWEFLQKIMSQKDLDIVCEENLLEMLDERSDRIRFW
ncbi:unnamed protein product [Meloidogyne enterolobii]|uniref:Uncharacterized protein n=1 Tax=Meloidogyne enterolobii TaxID=390850 RepID=A0ACB0ZB60_MELEN